MDDLLFDLLDQEAPKFNPLVANGLAVEHMKKAEQYIDRIFRCAEVGFPEGLRYVRCERCSPEEEYAEITRRRNVQNRGGSRRRGISGNQRTFEIARSDIYLMKYIFDYKGEEIKRYLFLPFVQEGGLITLRGSTFAISPVLADRAISVADDHIFVPLTMARIKFKRDVQHFYKNGQRETVWAFWSALYNRSAKSLREGRPAVHGETTLAHYLFCKVGVTRAFAEYGNADVVIGTDETITEENYPPNEWVICASTQLKPKRLRVSYYKGSNVRLAIPVDQYNTITSSLIGGFFYVVDRFPDRVIPDYVDETRLWKVLLGHLIFPGGVSEGKLVEDIDIHLYSVDGYLDEMAKEDLKDAGVYCSDIYDLFVHIIDTFTERVTQAGNSVSSMYGKRLMILRYVLFDLTRAIFTFMFKFQNAVNKEPTKDDIIKEMNYRLKPDLITRINHQHGEVSSISSPNDNKVFKITSNLVLQTDSSGRGARSKTNVSDPAHWLHASVAEVGSYGNLPKSKPTGRGRINPYVHVTPEGLIERKQKFYELLNNIQKKIER